MMRRARILAALAFVSALSGCIQWIPGGTSPRPRPAPDVVAGVSVSAGPGIASLRLDPADARDALLSFRESCPRLVARTDGSGLTRGADWKAACDNAGGWPLGSAVAFFEQNFEAGRVGDGKAFATGYYEPEIAGVKTRRTGYGVPVYALPPDLVRARPGDAPAMDNGQMPLGRYDRTGLFMPYYTRAEIEDGALTGRGLELAWVADPVEFFFLQVQGSGRLRAPDGSIVRLGYGGQNGHPYTGIGSVMRQRGLIGSGPGQVSGSMQGIMEWLRANPVEGREMMRQNNSWVFFAERPGDAAIGALNVPVRARSSVAADPKFTPLGAPIWLNVDRAEAHGLWIAQDTGGAIKGANRFDTFWGAGAEARRVAGGMSARGDALIFLPRGTLRRLGAQ